MSFSCQHLHSLYDTTQPNMSTFDEPSSFEEDSSSFFPSVDETSSSDSSKPNTTKTTWPETDTANTTKDFEYTMEPGPEETGPNERQAESSALAGFENFTETLEEWEDSMSACRQLLESIPQVQRCLRPDDLNPPHKMCKTGWHAMGEFQTAAKTEHLDLSFLAKQYGKQTVASLERFLHTQTAVVRSAHETLFTMMEYFDMLASMLRHVDAQYKPGPWGTEGNRTAGDAEMDIVRDLLGQIAKLKEENFKMKRQISAPPPKSESVEALFPSGSREGLCPRRCCKTTTQPEMEAASPVRSAESSELQSISSFLSDRSVPFAADRLTYKGENIADVMDESLALEHQRNSDTFSEGQAELLQQPRQRTEPRPVSDWLSQANATSCHEPCAGLEAKYDDLAEENRLLDADLRQLSEEYNVLDATHGNMTEKYDDLKEKFQDVLEEYDLLRRRHDYERVIHNRVTAMYVTRTSGVHWNGSKQDGKESPCASPKTAMPFRTSAKGPWSPALGIGTSVEEAEGVDECQAQTFCSFVSNQWHSWITMYDLLWSTILVAAQPSGEIETQQARWPRRHQTQNTHRTSSRGKHGGEIPWGALFNIVTHVVLVTSILSWFSCQLERDIWLQANGLTRNQLIAYTRGELVWLSNLGLGSRRMGEARTLALCMMLNSQRVMTLCSMCSRVMGVMGVMVGDWGGIGYLAWLKVAALLAGLWAVWDEGGVEVIVRWAVMGSRACLGLMSYTR